MQLADYYEAPRIRIFSFYMPPGDDPATHREAVLSRMAELTRPRGGSRHHADPRKRKGNLRRHRRASGGRARLGELAVLIHAFDPANYLEVGQAIDEAWSLLRPHVKHFHVKDYDTKIHRNVPAGAGDGQIPWLLADAAATATTASAFSSRTWLSPRSRSGLPGPSGLPMRRTPLRQILTQANDPFE